MVAESAEAFIVRRAAEWEAERDRGKLLETVPSGDRAKDFWIREAWTFLRQANLQDKILVLERIRYIGGEGRKAYSGGATTGDVEYRFGYFIVGNSGRWTHPPYPALIPEADLARLLDQARRNGTLRV